MSVDTVERNRKKLLELVDDSFLASIFENKLEMPHVLRRTFTFLRECVRQRYPNSANMSRGGFLFFRFFCPVIVAPHQQANRAYNGYVWAADCHRSKQNFECR